MYGANEKVFQQMSIDKNRIVTITVSGLVGSGKSTVAAAIDKALRDYGCWDVIVNEEHADDVRVAWARMEENIEAVEEILSKTAVVINVITTIRDMGV